ncbi:hypothetical protein PC116_g16412 [Phytophthora cactorum]|nr:hypothetical protein Pcac1_g5403 [Phytophthora cactorum]KAG2799897.1 hypothetical protein PC112_g20712 [Phytophthora cactorum]KAG2821350.1 hypothetical protein PC111_g11057 [Phytophthora cactorum]KAG2833091.1 hypothetical protein PC113_g20636 [Phytophthora cactorum]KAG2878869.1 hypothetical protein PC114_g22869 [Phytophthora cactorum]
MKTNARADQGKQKPKRQREQGESDKSEASVAGQRKRQKQNSVATEATTSMGANEEESPLTVDEVGEAVVALEEMFERWRQGKRQIGKRRKCEPYKLSLSQIGLIADRYRAARNRNGEIDYEVTSNNKNFASFKGHPEELRAKEPEVIVFLRRALAEKCDAESSEPERDRCDDIVKLKKLSALEAENRELKNARAQGDAAVKKMKKLEDLEIKLYERANKLDERANKIDNFFEALASSKDSAVVFDRKLAERELAIASNEAYQEKTAQE